MKSSNNILVSRVLKAAIAVALVTLLIGKPTSVVTQAAKEPDDSVCGLCNDLQGNAVDCDDLAFAFCQRYPDQCRIIGFNWSGCAHAAAMTLRYIDGRWQWCLHEPNFGQTQIGCWDAGYDGANPPPSPPPDPGRIPLDIWQALCTAYQNNPDAPKSLSECCQQSPEPWIWETFPGDQPMPLIWRGECNWWQCGDPTTINQMCWNWRRNNIPPNYFPECSSLLGNVLCYTGGETRVCRQNGELKLITCQVQPDGRKRWQAYCPGDTIYDPGWKVCRCPDGLRRELPDGKCADCAGDVTSCCADNAIWDPARNSCQCPPPYELDRDATGKYVCGCTGNNTQTNPDGSCQCITGATPKESGGCACPSLESPARDPTRCDCQLLAERDASGLCVCKPNSHSVGDGDHCECDPGYLPVSTPEGDRACRVVAEW